MAALVRKAYEWGIMKLIEAWEGMKALVKWLIDQTESHPYLTGLIGVLSVGVVLTLLSHLARITAIPLGLFLVLLSLVMVFWCFTFVMHRLYEPHPPNVRKMTVIMEYVIAIIGLVFVVAVACLVISSVFFNQPLSLGVWVTGDGQRVIRIDPKRGEQFVPKRMFAKDFIKFVRRENSPLIFHDRAVEFATAIADSYSSIPPEKDFKWAQANQRACVLYYEFDSNYGNLTLNLTSSMARKVELQGVAFLMRRTSSGIVYEYVPLTLAQNAWKATVPNPNQGDFLVLILRVKAVVGSSFTNDNKIDDFGFSLQAES